MKGTFLSILYTIGDSSWSFFKLNRCKLKINDTVLTGHATGLVDNMQIQHVFQQESVYHFLKFAAQEKPNLWQVH